MPERPIADRGSVRLSSRTFGSIRHDRPSGNCADDQAGDVVKALLLAALLAGSNPHPMTAGEARAASNALIRRQIPQMDQSRRTITTEQAADHWAITYSSPDDVSNGGPVIVHVSKRTRRARIVQMPN